MFGKFSWVFWYFRKISVGINDKNTVGSRLLASLLPILVVLFRVSM